MQPPSLSNNISSTTTIHLSPEHRARLYSLVQQLNDDQLRLFVNNHFQSISNINLSNQLQRFSRPQLIQQAFVFVDNYYTMDLEQSLYAILQKRFVPEYRSTSLHQQIPQVQRQQNYSSGFNQTPYYFPHQTTRFSPTQDYRPPIVTNVSAQLRPIRLNHNSASNNHTVNHSVNPVRPSQTSNYFTPTMHCQSYTAQSSTPVVMSSNESSTSSSSGASHRYQVPNLPPPPSSIVRSAMPIVPNIVNVKHKTLPFYRSIICVYESYQAFRYDSYRKQYTARHEFLLPVDICNQLALSFDYDPDLDIHKTNKCLLLRLVRFDQPPPPDGRYNDHLPPNLTIQINGQNVTNLPTPKPCTRQQTDLIRVGREIDITSYCMFNPMLPNEFMMTWMYRPENASLHTQYANAQFAVHLFLVQHLSVDDLCEQIKTKPIKFYHEDLARLVAKVQANDRELGLEVSDQILKLKCPIDQRRLRIPIRAVTCQHLQCFDLTNYITMNEKASKWICPVCNKSALYDDLQIDSYTESILNSIENENIIEIAIDGDLHWRSTTSPSSSVMNSEPRHQRQITAQIMDIILDDDHQEQRSDPQIDSKLHIPLIKTQPNEPGDVILIDDD